MAKQTFTTGQVLTAAQMTSLQQTAMGGGTASTKTTSYVLVAADAGTVVQMNAAGATTITVNTALFAAGDVVFIQNIGAGVCTITAGTATVTSAGSLALGQWEGGQLFFNSTSASVFFDYVQTGATSPLTTKGDVWGYSTLDARIPIGTNNQVLTADSAQALGLKWATPSGSTKSYALLSTTSLISASTITVSSLGGYDDLLFMLYAWTCGTASSQLKVRFNADTGSNYNAVGLGTAAAATYDRQMLQASYDIGATSIDGGTLGTIVGAGLDGTMTLRLSGANSTGFKAFTMLTGTLQSGASSTMTRTKQTQGIWENAALTTSVSVISSAGNFTAGTLRIYAAV